MTVPLPCPQTTALHARNGYAGSAPPMVVGRPVRSAQQLVTSAPPYPATPRSSEPLNAARTVLNEYFAWPLMANALTLTYAGTAQATTARRAMDELYRRVPQGQ